jgi:hypothetical protein
MSQTTPDNGSPNLPIPSPPPQGAPSTKVRKVSPFNGPAWLVEGVKLFFRFPGPWMMLLAFGSLIMLIGQLVPVIGPLFFYATYFIWIAGLMACCRLLHQGQPFQFQQVFVGFKSGARTLMSLSLIYTVIEITVIAFFTEPFIRQLQSPQMSQQEMQQLLQDPEFLKALLWSRLALVPVQMAMVFTPALVLFQQRSLLSAVQLSFAACMQNFPAVVLYLLSLVAMGVLATLPALLGWFILIPATIASVYFAYMDIFEQSKQSDDCLVV